MNSAITNKRLASAAFALSPLRTIAATVCEKNASVPLILRNPTTLQPAAIADRLSLANQYNRCRGIIWGNGKYITAMTWWPPEKRDEAVRRIPEIREGLANDARKPLDSWGPVIHEERYNLAQDPGEAHNRFALGPDLGRMQQARDDYRARCQANTTPHKLKAVQPQMNEQDLERLRTIGYLDAPTP